ncbi:hypothetical protein HPB47_015262, partial [Ixodes persulcatus]
DCVCSWSPGFLVFPTMASTVLPAKGVCFSFSVPADTAVDEIMDAFQVAAGSGGLKFLQHQGGTRFMSSVTSMSAANRLVAQGNFVLRDVAVPLEAVGVYVLHVSIYRLLPYVTEEAVVQAIAPFGKVKSITYVSYRDRSDILTGTRVVKVEMTKPTPNFITIQGHRVMVGYPGADRKGTSGQPARPHAVNVAPFSGIQQRAVPPLVCGAVMPTQQRTVYSVDPTPLWPTQRELLDPTSHRRVSQAKAPLFLSCSMTIWAPPSVRGLVQWPQVTRPPVIHRESDVADSSHSPGRLVVSDDTDLTPGQREPPNRSDLSPSTQRGSSKFSSSDEGEDGAADRGDAKRTFPSTSSVSDGPIASTLMSEHGQTIFRGTPWFPAVFLDPWRTSSGVEDGRFFRPEIVSNVGMVPDSRCPN